MTARLRAWLCAGIALGAAQCARTVTPTGGLMLVFGTDGTLRPDSLRVRIRSGDESKTYRDSEFALSQGLDSPQSFAIQSNDDPHASVTVEASVWQNGSNGGAAVPLDIRQYRISNIPTRQVVELDVVFTAKCRDRVDPDQGVSRCLASSTCDETGECVSNAISADQLPAFPADAGLFEPAGDAGSDGSDAGDASTAESAADAEAGDASDSALDANECSPNDERCVGNTPQYCLNGRWQNSNPCTQGHTHCSGVRCVSVPPSCSSTVGPPPGAGFDCSPSGTADCCATYLVPGGTFHQCYDGQANPDKTHAATISAFRLDAYEVTVGRFRQFVSAIVKGAPHAPPAAGEGKHTHLNGGLGLTDLGDAGPLYESGWDPAWTANLPQSASDWNARLADPVNCSETATWTETAGSNEVLPITCVDWYSAYAFCIWDHAFLPSSAEWNYAAAGGAEQRVYPWGNQAPALNTELAIWGCHYGGGGCPPHLVNVARVGSAPLGNGKWGQSDLAGSVWEWTLDKTGWLSDPKLELPAVCDDCASVGMGPRRSLRGGAFENQYTDLLVSVLLSSRPELPHPDVGFRCARIPSDEF